MTISRRKEIFSDLDNSEMAVKKVLEGATEALFLHKPDDTTWSMAELVEHIIIVEKGVLGTIQKIGAKASEEPIISKLDDKAIVKLLSNRKRKVEAPAHFVPKGIFTSKEIALQKFQAHRADIQDFITTTTLPLKNIGFPHPIVGMLNAENWFTFMAGHCQRHASQMAEISNAGL